MCDPAPDTGFDSEAFAVLQRCIACQDLKMKRRREAMMTTADSDTTKDGPRAAGKAKLLDDLKETNGRFDAKYVIWTVEEYRKNHPIPKDAKGEVFIQKGPDGPEITEIHHDADIEQFLPIHREYRACDELLDTPRNAFGRHLTLAREKAQAEAVLSRLPPKVAEVVFSFPPPKDPPSYEMAKQATRLREWADRLDDWMARESKKLLKLTKATPTLEAIDFLIDLYFSKDLFFESHSEVLSVLYTVPHDMWEDKLLKVYSSMTLAEAGQDVGLLIFLDEPEHWENKEALLLLVIRWIEELQHMIDANNLPRLEESPEERLLSAMFGTAASPLSHPHKFLEELKSTRRKLAEQAKP